MTNGRLSIHGYPPIHVRNTVSDRSIVWQCLVRSQYEFRDFPQARRLLEQYAQAAAPLIIDCGANIGLASVWFAQHFPKARVYAIEPDAENFNMLLKNVAPFGDRVTPLRGAVWNRREELTISNPRSGAAAFRVAPGSGVAAYTIDDICGMAGADPLIVKIDIEGAQKQLFSSNTEWVGRTHLITLELDDWLMPWQGTSRPFFSCISQYPYDYLMRGESIFCFRDCDDSGNSV